MKTAPISQSTSSRSGSVVSANENDESILAHRAGLTRPERAEPTSQVLIRHRGNGTLDSMRRWGGGRWSARLRHHDCPGSFRTGCVTGALLLETLDSAPYPIPSLPGELKTARNGGGDSHLPEQAATAARKRVRDA